MSFENMLLINVALWGVILLGVVIFGYKPKLYILLMNTAVILCLMWIEKINVKIPTYEYSFLFISSEYIFYPVFKFSNTGAWCSINATNYCIFHFFLIYFNCYGFK